MFIDFFYRLRAEGMDISLKEWLTLMEALRMGLHNASMRGLLRLCMTILCKSETEYDTLQICFADFFYKKMAYDTTKQLTDELTDEMEDWMEETGMPPELPDDIQAMTDGVDSPWTLDEVEELKERTQNRIMQNMGGYRYVGTHGISAYGHSGFNPNNAEQPTNQGGGHGTRAILEKREFRDFREDNVLDIRQFQMAFRRLRHLTNQSTAPDEFDVDQTITDTCKMGGILQVRFKKPRRNNIKVLLLMDSGGSMAPHSQLCSRLFQAASKSNRFKDLQVYYFHNCIEENLYTNPTLEPQYAKLTVEVLRKHDPDYRVILVGDAAMDIDELIGHPGEVTNHNLGYSGEEWFQLIQKRYRHAVWLNPYGWNFSEIFGDWGKTHAIISDLFPMYHMSINGLDQAMRKLMAPK
jgi:hypothetical protein